ncbi:uncharacterized protein RHTO_03870 [Rhodotorula toruloides NP11]|uniref:Uncharacterized protein n=1 Tax=Rhodotorula toruloides (strain NP11) TaxID=1130832 RepID=M7WHW1_RHOT1|nr:uncharacterized protein RHTO_03870 [Rhodotorula toruloides NP11]EMS20072.1 hypothetical protein RHTO_03870 [Rhodotorula toruloides NP11]
MKISFAIVIAALVGSVAAAPALDARAEKVNAIKQMRSYVDLEARGPPGGHPEHQKNGGPPGEHGEHNSEGNGRGWGKGGRPGNPGHHGGEYKNDPNNCGEEGNVCPPSYNGVGQPICVKGQCALQCPPGTRQFSTNSQYASAFCA